MFIVDKIKAMAEKSAHLTSTLQARPSIFDYIAQEALSSQLNPAAKRLVDALYLKYPKTELLLRWFDETFLLSSSLLHFYYLKHYGGTFSECFYGLRRVSARQAASSALTRREVLLSLFAVTLIPYLRHKLNVKAEELYFRNVPRKDQKRKEMFIKFNSTLQIAFQLSNFVQHLRYLGGQSQFNSPMLWLTGLTLAYGEPTQEAFTWRNLFPLVVQRSFEVGAFFLQCYQEWQAESHGVFGALPPPPPPEIAQDEADLAGICPICRKQRQVDTVLSVSGLVFCFNCIQRQIAEYKRCPVTQLPASFHDLIRLYPAGS